MLSTIALHSIFSKNNFSADDEVDLSIEEIIARASERARRRESLRAEGEKLVDAPDVEPAPVAASVQTEPVRSRLPARCLVETNLRGLSTHLYIKLK